MSEPLIYEPATDGPLVLWGQCSQGETEFLAESPPAPRQFAPRPIPPLPSMSTMGSHRNKPCPCGKKHPDGRPIKFKHCCLGNREKAFQQAVVAQREARQRARYETWQRDQADFSQRIIAVPLLSMPAVTTPTEESSIQEQS